jgi:hypothetical protein
MDHPYSDPNEAPWTDEYAESHYPKWLESDESDAYLMDDALYGVI